MEISNLPYYVKFLFKAENACLSTTDINAFQYIIDESTKSKVFGFHAGQRIHFIPETNKIYEITSVQIKQLHTNTDDFHYGIDMEDCIEKHGTQKEMLFKILIMMKLIS